jgi:hypothetical protein
MKWADRQNHRERLREADGEKDDLIRPRSAP